jgi:hypothetical protein
MLSCFRDFIARHALPLLSLFVGRKPKKSSRPKSRELFALQNSSSTGYSLGVSGSLAPSAGFSAEAAVFSADFSTGGAADLSPIGGPDEGGAPKVLADLDDDPPRDFSAAMHSCAVIIPSPLRSYLMYSATLASSHFVAYSPMLTWPSPLRSPRVNQLGKPSGRRSVAVKKRTGLPLAPMAGLLP